MTNPNIKLIRFHIIQIFITLVACTNNINGLEGEIKQNEFLSHFYLGTYKYYITLTYVLQKAI